jgi:hypothetical protein
LNQWYRHMSKGGWPFSTADHGWCVSDCTATGLEVNIAHHIRQRVFPILFSSFTILTRTFGAHL